MPNDNNNNREHSLGTIVPNIVLCFIYLFMFIYLFYLPGCSHLICLIPATDCELESLH